MSKPSGASRHSAFFVQPDSFLISSAAPTLNGARDSRGPQLAADAGSAVLTSGALATACAGLFIAGVLSAGHILDLPIPCGGSQGCDTVAAHPASKIAGVPIAFLGVLAYLAQIAVVGRASLSRRSQWLFAVTAGLGAAASAGLLLYAQLVIRATCLWCVASAVAMFLQFGFGLVWLRCRRVQSGPRWWAGWGLGLLTALMIGVQVGRMERQASAPPVGTEALTQLGPGVLDDPLKAVGPASAVVTVVVFADLLCPACRDIMPSLLQYQQANPAYVRIVYRHRPLWNIRGHESSKAAAALSEIAAEAGKFWAFAHAVHVVKPVTRNDYVGILQALQLDVGTSEARLNDPADPAIIRVQRDMGWAEQLGIHATPTFLVFVGNRTPVSATLRGLPRVLNSAAVVLALADARNAVRPK